MHLVSVVIPAFNRGWSIEKTVQSVIAQTYQHWEIIIVDDASTDETLGKLVSLSKRDQRIRYLKHDVNCGAQAARNTGVKAANGDFIAFLDSDDEWYPDKLEKQISAFESLPESIGVVHCDSDIYFESTGKKRRYKVPQLSGSVYNTLLQMPGPLYQCLMVKRACFEQIPDAIDPDVPSFQEWDTCINLASKFGFYFINEPLMIYNIHKGEAISKDSDKFFRGYLYIVKKHREDILRYCGAEALGAHYFFVATRYLDIKDYSNACYFFRMAKEYGINNKAFKLFTYIALMMPKLASSLFLVLKTARRLVT